MVQKTAHDASSTFSPRRGRPRAFEPETALTQAMDVFWSDGFAATSLDDISAATGGRLVTYVGYGHTWLLNGSTNACMHDVVTSYFVDGIVPAKGTRCSASS